jgi:hypothetical protein
MTPRRFLVLLVLPILAGCANLSLPISDVPDPGARPATVTITRQTSLAQIWPYYVSLDGVIVAQLRGWEYTTFPVSEGAHRIGVIWQAKPLSAYRGLLAEAGKTYFFDVDVVIGAGALPRALAMTPTDRIGGTYTRGGKTFTFVAPGKGGG